MVVIAVLAADSSGRIVTYFESNVQCWLEQFVLFRMLRT